MTRTIIAVVFFTIHASPFKARAAESCTTLRPGASPAAASTIGIFADARLAPEIAARALGAWSDCAAWAPELPRFTLGRSGTRDLFVVYDPAAIGAAERCGAFQGRTITLFSRTRNRHGSVVGCGSLTQNLIHELGHALGLADSPRSCNSFAMSKLDPNNRFHRRVQPAECRALEARWVPLPLPPVSPWTEPLEAPLVAAGVAYP